MTLVWADDGHGVVQDPGALAPGEGIYYHSAMIDGLSNHYTVLIPPATIQQQLGRAIRLGATDYLVVNTSNLRPVPMTTEEVMEILWNSRP